MGLFIRRSYDGHSRISGWGIHAFCLHGAGVNGSLSHDGYCLLSLELELAMALMEPLHISDVVVVAVSAWTWSWSGCDCGHHAT
jgi:hypothetical protein